MSGPTRDPAQIFGGIVLMCVGVAALSVNDALGKALTSQYPPLQVLFMRNAIALPFAVLVVLRLGGARALKSYRPVTHLLRGALWLAAAGLFFTGIQYLGLAEATALIFVAPVFITALGALLLKEHVGWRRWLAVLAGFGGVLIVMRPGGAAFQPASFLPIATAFFYALLMISARWVDPRESVWTLMLYLVGGGGLLAAFIMPFIWVPLRPQDWMLFLAIAFFGTAGMTMMTQAFRLAPAAVVAPFDYTALIWATLLGLIFWAEIPDAATYFGAGVIIASGGFILWRESRARKKAPAPARGA